MRDFGRRATLSIALSITLGSAGAAQDNPNAAIEAETARYTAQAALDKARAEAVKAKADAKRARIEALGLPEYENKATIGEGGAKLEAAMLGGTALSNAAEEIKRRLCGLQECTGANYLVLAGDEKLDFGQAESLAAETKYVAALFDDAGCRTGPKRMPAADIVVAVAAVSAAAKLFATETEVTGMDLTTALPSRLLATRVAALIKGIRPGDMIAAPANSSSTLVRDFDALAVQADCAEAAKAKIPEKPNAAQKLTAAALTRALKRYEALYDRATTADDEGMVPIMAAQRLDALLELKPAIVRVRTEFANGSFIKYKNLWTLLGADPVRVSGGIIASYQVTDPRSGQATEGDILVCRTTLASLRAIQAGQWRPAGSVPSCGSLSEGAAGAGGGA